MSTENVSLGSSQGASGSSTEQSTENNYSENELDNEIESNESKSTRQSHSSSLNCLNMNNEKEINASVIVAQKNYLNHISYNIETNETDISASNKSFLSTCCSVVNIVIGLIMFTIGLMTIVVPIYDFVLSSRLQMIPGHPSFEQWVKPSPEVRLSVYIFTVENGDAFLNGTDEKLRLKEIGPIIYREHLHHQNIVHHDNSTLSYTAARHIEFLEDQNEPGILNRTILVPNFVVLASAASINNNFFKKIGFNVMLSQSTDVLITNVTIYNYLWHFSSDVVNNIQNMASFLVPTNNSGVLHQIYADFNDRYNVRIAPGYSGDHFFEITSVNGDTVVPRFDLSRGECNASIIGSTEGALYKTHLTEKSVLWYWRKSLCRQVPLYFEKKVQKGSFEAYKYILHENVYDRSANLDEDCYKGFYDILPDGLSDLSKCFFDMPFAASNPHFYGRYPNALTSKLEGFNPVRDKHQSFIIVEPIMGVPIDQSARSQSNVIIPELHGFNEEILRFSNMALPTFWVEYHQRQLTPNIERLMFLTLYVLPILQYFITAILLIGGGVLVTRGVWYCVDTSPSENLDSSKYEKNCKMHEPTLIDAWHHK